MLTVAVCRSGPKDGLSKIGIKGPGLCTGPRGKTYPKGKEGVGSGNEGRLVAVIG